MLILVVFRPFSHLILSLSFLCSSVYEAPFAISLSFLSERFSSVHAKAALAYVTRYEKIDHLQDFLENLVLAIMRYSNLLAIRSSFYYSFIIEHHEVIAPNAHSVLLTAKRKYWRKR